MKHKIIPILLLAFLALTPLIATLNPYTAHAAPPTRPHADFNGDWYADLAIGAPGESLGAAESAGAANILYGRAGGLDDAASQFWYQGHNGLQDTPEASDGFGQALAVGDFDGNGFYDLAVGVPGTEVGGEANAGAVHLLWGYDQASGLSGQGDLVMSQDSANILDDAEAGDYFGSALAAGDFDGNGCDDLAVGVAEEDFGSRGNAGAVNILYGTPAGTFTNHQLWHQDNAGGLDLAEANDKFGSALAVGDFNGDGYDDLAVSAPFEDSDTINDFGVVHVLFGSEAGLASTGSEIWHQDSPGVPDTAEAFDQFGYALAAGDFNGDGRDDLAVGVSGENAGAGAANILYGAASGLDPSGPIWQQGGDVSDTPEAGDGFGNALAAGDLDGDGYADLAVGVSGEDVGSVIDTGAVNVIYGSAQGLTSRDQFWHQNSTGISDPAETSDMFGYALAVGDFDGNGYGDLAVGVPYEAIGSVGYAGAVNVIYGSANGLSPQNGQQFWHQDSAGIADEAEVGDVFGWALAAIPRNTHRVYLPSIVR